MPNLDKYIKAIWSRYAIWGFVLLLVVALGALTWLQLVLGVDVRGAINAWMGRP